VFAREPEAKTAARTRDPASHLEMRTVFAYCSMGLSFEWVHVHARPLALYLNFLFLFVRRSVRGINKKSLGGGRCQAEQKRGFL
jgi:hypothetical protein